MRLARHRPITTFPSSLIKAMDDLSPEAWKLLQQMTPALIGLLGVIVGAFLTTIREWWSQRQRTKKAAAYLTAIVGGELDRFILACSEVAQDSGEPDQIGEMHPRASRPKFEPEQLQVEWLSIPEDVMFPILDLPNQVRAADNAIADVYTYGDDPPEYIRTYQESQYQYSLIGLDAINAVSRLRSHARLRPRKNDGQWDPTSLFERKVIEYRARRKKEEAEHRALLLSQNA